MTDPNTIDRDEWYASPHADGPDPLDMYDPEPYVPTTRACLDCWALIQIGGCDVHRVVAA